MDEVKLPFQAHSRVRLRGNVDPGIYGEYAVAGNEGTVEGIDEDRFGLPQVLIKWDKNHWAYNGVPDCWTFPEHFELVEDSMDNKDKAKLAQDAAMMFANTISSLFTESSKTQKGDNIGSKAQTLIRNLTEAASPFQAQQAQMEIDPYDEAAQAASEKLATSEGFIIVGVERNANGSLEAPYAFGISKTDQAELAVEAHLTGVAARAHQELVLRALHNLDVS